MRNVFYVSPDGDDANIGNEESPFATLVRVRDAVRDAEGAVTVYLRDDFPTYFLALDEPDDGAEIEWDRGRNPNKETYAWW